GVGFGADVDIKTQTFGGISCQQADSGHRDLLNEGSEQAGCIYNCKGKSVMGQPDASKICSLLGSGHIKKAEPNKWFCPVYGILVFKYVTFQPAKFEPHRSVTGLKQSSSPILKFGLALRV
ncbi:MAG: hypothetical protein KJP06_08520, partial [Deltaproteobacteria bacterium]|nr:hypothetical protein [Deltaproteobacteria bacterium]